MSAESENGQLKCCIFTIDKHALALGMIESLTPNS
jgi:hypothetical protein